MTDHMYPHHLDDRDEEARRIDESRETLDRVFEAIGGEELQAEYVEGDGYLVRFEIDPRGFETVSVNSRWAALKIPSDSILGHLNNAIQALRARSLEGRVADGGDTKMWGTLQAGEFERIEARLEAVAVVLHKAMATVQPDELPF